MENLDEAYLRIKSKISSVREKNPSRKSKYSDELISEVLAILPKERNFAHCSRQLGIAECILRRWVKRKPLLAPRKLTVTPKKNICIKEYPSVSLPEFKEAHQTFEARLTNGIVLKGLLLTTENLNLLGKLQ